MSLNTGGLTFATLPDRMRSVLASMTGNRFTGVLTGLGVIMGANIGTTVTAWIISAIGFKVNISALALPILCIGTPLIYSNKIYH